jgi:tight adherence protein C
MPPLVILAAVAVASALPLLWWSLAGVRTATRQVDPGRLGGSRPTADLRAAVLRQSAADRALRPALQGLAELARRVTPLGWIDALDRRIARAGAPAAWPLERVLAAKGVATAAAFFVGVVLFADNRTTLRLLLWLAGMAFAYLLPDLLLLNAGLKRREAITLELPDSLDQMTVAVEAGLGFEAAMLRVARTGRGVLAAELSRTLREVQVGVPRRTALRDLADRAEVPDLRRFVLAVIQAEGYGIPIADVLRVQAAELRAKRRQRAEEKAMKIPVKVVFPMIVCILPVVFIIILGPAVFQLGRTL